MTKDDFLALYERSLSGIITPEEKKLLELYRDEFVLADHPWDEVLMGNREGTGKLIYSGIEAGMAKDHRKAVRSLFSVGIKVAAVLLPLIVAGIYLWREAKNKDSLPVTEQTGRPVNDVPPGGNRAVLTLANGSSIVLDSAQNGLLSQQGSTKVMKTENGQLSYMKGRTADNVLAYNTISTPRGGQYNVVLPDGSRVWLDAASSLRFPTAFTGEERRVEVTGEAFFEIARDPARPFKVIVPGTTGRSMEIAVLGTSFNIMAYEEEDAVRTTLVEGAVKVEKDGQAWQLKPGQQGILKEGVSGKKEGASVSVENDADIDAVTAWKNGRFEFRGNIKGIMRQIARWYDVEVEYEGNVSDKAFNVAISRASNASEVLKFLALTGSIHFAIEGRKIKVMP